MKAKIIVLLVITFTVLSANAQRDAQYTQFFFNGIVYNPALAGATDNLLVTGLYRTQWTGFGEGRPITQTLSAITPVAPLRGGVGVHLVNDELGFDANTGIFGSYGYRIELENGVISPGIGLGFMQRAVDGSKFNAKDNGDGAIPNGKNNDISTTLSLGVYYTNEDFYLGASINNLNSPKVEYTTSTGLNTVNVLQHFYFSGGYTYAVSQNLDLIPNALIKFDKINNAIVADVNMNALYKEKYFGGVTYRHGDAAAAIVGYAINDRISLSYSYDFTLNKLGSVSSGTHEFVFRYEVPIYSKGKENVIIKTPRFL